MSQSRNQPKDSSMSKHIYRRILLMFLAVAGLTSCSKPSNSQDVARPGFPPAVAPVNGTDVGRFQAVVINDGERGGTVVMLLDTREGATWIYRPPQGAAINGYWSDIPRLNYAPDFWRNAFNQQTQEPVPTPAPGPTPVR